MSKYRPYYVPFFFLILSIFGIITANVSTGFVLGQLYSRFLRNAIFLLALIIPIISGMGINFAITIGAIAAQMAMVIVIDMGLPGGRALLLAAVMSIGLAVALGNIVGFLLNKAKGKEMIASIVIGFLGTNVYQLIFMVGYGTVITPFNEEILLTRGIGVKSMLDCMDFKTLFAGIMPITIGDTTGSLLPIIIVFILALIVHLISVSKIGYHMRAVGENLSISEKLGIDVDKTRRISIVISTVLAALAHLMFVQDLGVINVYSGHLNLDIFSAAALLAGGATFKKATIKNAFIGVILFHTLFIISPLAGQNLFKNPALGEYFRSFIAYGTIIFALMLNLKHEKANTAIIKVDAKV
ncbi:ABC transporter permease subunit [Clostridium formicaceticum]|uniref:Branched-chain amino acid transport system / permease component n=1 Tax=Clostridium formicaceticum TaxID=1497 RepID=A0AAC9RN75_9CLOT|nr:hypothetical protein [Clostridium formicaceticum]AOY78071.1 hypothetical protein BJL90_20710 [Clostridium formicaceticum]ARE88712.1 Branched-chain amino acid transport system / permease component [Clostridium formicaceticum]